ncbi:MAG: cysteine desulfuration protein SufE [Sphingobacteriales bacterium]|jgi:cysteine desulfuration protein SufE
MGQGIKEIEQEIIDDFEFLGDWTDRYQYIIEQGKALAPLANDFKIEGNRIKGCQSQVWLVATLEGNKIVYQADSDAAIVKGLVALLVRVFSYQNPDEVVEAPVDFIEKIGMKEHLSPTRSNGLSEMINQIKKFAKAFQTSV